MRLGLFLLAAACLVVGTALADGNNEPSPFGKDKDYIYVYNAQITSGLIAPSDEDAADPQQKASTRIQAQAKLTFTSDRHAQLRLQQIRVAQLNEQLMEPEQVQPMAIFEPKQIPEEKRTQLEQPCQFSYANGVIERVQFADNDEAWSKNIKRAVLNMIQLNLKKNNEQGLRSGDGTESEQDDDEEPESDQHSISGQLYKFGKTFSIPEITVEGACQTTYAINNAGNQLFNVTKTINFKQCSKIADVAYGYQTQQQQPQCAGCQLYWFKKQQKQLEQQQPGQQHPCQKCDPKEVNEQTLDRSTTLRYQLACQSGNDCLTNSKKYALKRTELLSQYVYKNMKVESGKYGSAMHTVVAATLRFQSAQAKSNDEVPGMSSSKVESLLFSNERAMDVKRFYMFGDEEYPEGSSSQSSPFHQVPKVQQAERALRKLAQTITGDKQKGIELQAGIEVQRLVEMLRMCSVQELKRIEQNAVNGGSSSSAQMNGEEQKKAKHFYTDALALCGTRNCVQQLAEKIQKKVISQPKAIQALKSITGLPAPSVSIANIVEGLCKQESVHQHKELKQACWLTFGALVNELCQHSTQKSAKQGPFGAQSGFDNHKQCPLEKKQQYKESIMELYKSAGSIYDKMVALSTLGNAGIDISVGDIEQIIKDQSEERLVRAKAIDALRRLRTQMPVKIQEILLPIFENTREVPEVRAASLACILGTQPGQKVTDQLVYTLAKESNRQVQAFAYRAMKTMSNSQNPVEKQLSDHIKNALKLANVDEQELRTSGKWQIPMFSQELQEGVFIGLVQMVSSRSAIPGYAHVQINSFLNDQYSTNQFLVYMAQQETEQWYQNAMRQFGKATIRGERRSSSANYGQSLRDLYSALGIKSRRSSYYSSFNDQQNERQEQQPFAMVALRTGDVDHGFVSIDNENMPEAIREMLNGQNKPKLNRIVEYFLQQQPQQQQQQQSHGAILTNLMEQEANIPTSCGLPLRVLTSFPVLAIGEGQVNNVNTESTRQESSSFGVVANVKAHVMANLVHIQKMECRLPFAVSGVESIRSVEVNAPIHAELNANANQGVTLKLKLPRSETTILGLHSLPFTYTAEVDTKTQLTHEPRHIKAIHQQKLERMQHEVDKTFAGLEHLGIPVHAQGHFHWPAQQMSYQQFLQMQMATENAVHFTIKPSQQTPREVQFRITGNSFQKTSGQMPQLQSFYNNKFGSALGNDEEYDIQTENDSQRRQKLQRFLGQYQPQQQYKHSLKIMAQTIGGPKECKAEATVQTICDDKLQACNVQLDAQRTPIGGESQKWTMKAEAQLAMPETVESAQQIAQLQQKNNRFHCQAKAKWGGESKQEINIRVQGETAKRPEWRQAEQQNRRLQRQAAFLNKYELEAEYQLKPEMQCAFGRALELVKCAYFWNSESQLTAEGSEANNNKVLASIVIDPITLQHANVTVRTPEQLVKLQQIVLPIRARPFALIRQQPASTNSFGQLFTRIELSGRAECTVDGRQVETFDGAEYTAPLSTNCYSVIAKDCGSEQPEFVVLMKAIESGKNGQKKLKVIGQDQQIECANRNGRVVCKQNGNQVKNDEDSDEVDYNNAQQTDVTVHLGGIAVRFNGRKAWLKVSSVYKNNQCGLCGHYDESDDADEWRMGNNQNTNDLVQFHRSYTLLGNKNPFDNDEEEQCSAQQLDSFYQKHGSSIRRSYNNNIDNEEEEEECDEQCQEWKNERFNGEWNNDESDEQQQQSEGNTKGKPVKITGVFETNHQICFSQKPVKQCPKGTVPVFDDDEQQQEDEEEEDNTGNNSGDGEGNGSNGNNNARSVRFTCMDRSSPEARRLQRQVERNGNVLPEQSLKQWGNSIAMKIREPKKCGRNRF